MSTARLYRVVDRRSVVRAQARGWAVHRLIKWLKWHPDSGAWLEVLTQGGWEPLQGGGGV